MTADSGLTREKLVERYTIEPDAVTFRAEVDFYTVSLRHSQRFQTHRAFHHAPPRAE